MYLWDSMKISLFNVGTGLLHVKLDLGTGYHASSQIVRLGSSREARPWYRLPCVFAALVEDNESFFEKLAS
jgi:hypothetical protein